MAHKQTNSRQRREGRRGNAETRCGRRSVRRMGACSPSDTRYSSTARKFHEATRGASGRARVRPNGAHAMLQRVQCAEKCTIAACYIPSAEPRVWRCLLAENRLLSELNSLVADAPQHRPRRSRFVTLRQIRRRQIRASEHAGERRGSAQLHSPLARVARLLRTPSTDSATNPLAIPVPKDGSCCPPSTAELARPAANARGRADCERRYTHGCSRWPGSA